MVESSLRILFLEDNPYDVDLVGIALRRAGIEFDITRVETRQDYLAHLQEPIDIILADYTLPQFTAIDALQDLKDAGKDIPLIVISGTISEETAVECIKQGASDYLLKDRLGRLGTAITNALEEKQLREGKRQTEEELNASEERYRFLVEFSPLPIILYVDQKISYVNQAGLKLFGANSEDEIIGKSSFDFVLPTERPEVQKREDRLALGESVEVQEQRIVRLDGRIIYAEIRSAPIELNGQKVALTVIRDITKQKHHERELQVIAAISEALRIASTPSDMVPVILDQFLFLLEAEGSALAFYEVRNEEIVFQSGRGIWSDATGIRMPATSGITAHVLSTGVIYHNNDVHSMSEERFYQPDAMTRVEAVACVPLIAQEENIGVFWVGKNTSFTEEDINLLKAASNIAGNALHRAFLDEELEANFLETVIALANTLDVRDTQTSDHSQRLALWAEATLQTLGGTEAENEAIRLAALLHDIGKIGVPDEILRKKGTLTEEEWEIMRRHPNIGAEIVAPIQKLTYVAPIIRAHQEKFDGSGYPLGLKGEEIPFAARVLTVVDAYGAMVEDRVYRPAMSAAEALQELNDCSGKHFDPDIVKAFEKVLKHLGEA